MQRHNLWNIKVNESIKSKVLFLKFFNTFMQIIKMILKQALRTIFMKMSQSFFVCAKQCLKSRPIHMTAFIGWLLIIIGNTDKFYQWNTSSIRKQLCPCPLKKKTCWPRKSNYTHSTDCFHFDNWHTYLCSLVSQLKVVNEVHISLVCCLLFAMQKQLNGLSIFIWGNLKLQKAVLICMKTASSNLWTNSAVMMVYLAITNRCLNLWTMPYFSWYWCRFIRHWRVRLFTFSKS